MSLLGALTNKSMARERGAMDVTLAAVVLPMAIVTLSRGLKARYGPHRAIARWTFPIWMYVSVTGVLVYVLLYQPTWLL